MKNSEKNNDSDRIDVLIRNGMLATGALAAVLFILSLIALIEFPQAFKAIAWSMAGVTVVFFILRTIYNYRNTFKVKDKKKPLN